jgi:hypothetical protein
MRLPVSQVTPEFLTKMMVTESATTTYNTSTRSLDDTNLDSTWKEEHRGGGILAKQNELVDEERFADGCKLLLVEEQAETIALSLHLGLRHRAQSYLSTWASSANVV